jgi:hypothetical protein
MDVVIINFLQTITDEVLFILLQAMAWGVKTICGKGVKERGVLQIALPRLS